jgi:hypothetical protein
VPLIEGSPAFQADGMLLITFDESDGAAEPDLAPFGPDVFSAAAPPPPAR